MLKVGQRWTYTDSQYSWVVEVIEIGSRPMGKIIQIIKDVYIESGSYTTYPVGSKYLLRDTMDSRFWKLLEGQDKPEDDHG